MTMPKFVINGFCHQHTAVSDYSHFEPHGGGDPVQSLLQVVESEWQPSFDQTERSILVTLDEEATARHGKFFTGVSTVTAASRLTCYFDRRSGGVENELPFLHARIVGGGKSQVNEASIVVYNQKVLTDEEKTHCGQLLQGQFHILTLLCGTRPPMPPVTLMRNHAAKVRPGTPEAVGGTELDATPALYLESILHWRDKLFCTARAPEPLLQANCAADFEYTGLAPVDTENMMLQAYFAPAYNGGVPFVQFRSSNAFSRQGSGRPRQASPCELACQHARFLGMPEGAGVVGPGYEPSAEEYLSSVLMYSNHAFCGVMDC